MLKFGESSSGQRWICSRISEALSVAKKNIRSSRSCLTKQLTSDRIRCSAPVDACQNGTSVAIKVRLEVAMVVGLEGNVQSDGGYLRLFKSNFRC